MATARCRKRMVSVDGVSCIDNNAPKRAGGWIKGKEAAKTRSSFPCERRAYLLLPPSFREASDQGIQMGSGDASDPEMQREGSVTQRNQRVKDFGLKIH